MDGGYAAAGFYSLPGMDDVYEYRIWVFKTDPAGNISDACPAGMITEGNLVMTSTAADVDTLSVTIEAVPADVVESDVVPGETSLDVEVQCTL